jgi:hypothetical protein
MEKDILSKLFIEKTIEKLDAMVKFNNYNKSKKVSQLNIVEKLIIDEFWQLVLQGVIKMDEKRPLTEADKELIRA